MKKPLKINVLGYGLMAKQIASLLYLGGFNIHIWNYKKVDPQEINRQIKFLRRTLPDNKTCEGTLNFYTDLNLLPKAITIESVVEELTVKKQLYLFFEKFGNLYFTNSSSFSPVEIGKSVNGLHFFNPINIGLVELYTTFSRVDSQMSAIISYLSELNFSFVKVNPNRGYIGNYILFNEISSALKLVEKYSYTIDQVNQVYGKLYDGRNLIAIIDLIGVDVVYKILKNLREDDESIYLPQLLSVALDSGILGKKNKTTIEKLLRSSDGKA